MEIIWKLYGNYMEIIWKLYGNGMKLYENYMKIDMEII